MPASTEDAFLWAIRQMESGGNYQAHNPGGALGAYQVMPAHLQGGNEWAGRVFGHAVTAKQFLASKTMQDQMARQILGGYYQKYGAAGAAAAWFSGSPDVNSTASDGNTTVRNYVKTVLALMAKAPAGGVGATGTTGTTGTTGGGDTTGTDASTTVTAASYKTDPKCLFGMDLPVIGGVCILTKGQGRAILGSLLIGAGGIVSAGGLIILAAYGLKATGALQGVANAAAVVPGAGGIAAKAVSASGALKAGPKSRPKKAKPAPKNEGQDEGGSDGGSE